MKAALRMIINYKYRLYPKPDQVHALERTLYIVRWGWNSMVRETRKVSRRKSAASRYQSELAKMKLNKQPRGRRVERLTRLQESGLSSDKALQAINLSVLYGVWEKSRGSGLAVEYATEMVDRRRKAILQGNRTMAPMGGVWVRLVGKYHDAWKACWKGVSKAPRKTRDACWLCVGIQNGIRIGKRNRANENYIDLSPVLLPRFRDNPAISRVPFIQHRQLPRGAQIKDLKVTRTSNRPNAQWHVVLAVEIDGGISYPSTGLACGIDPGLKTAATVVGDDITKPGHDGFEIVSGMRKPIKKLRRLQRRLDRQNRANNQECFDEKGAWRRGVRANNVSKRMLETQERIAAIQRHAADVRLNHYNHAANEILSRYDTVYFGNWTDGTPESKGRAKKKRREAFELDGTRRQKGEAARQRGINQMARDNALGILKRLLQEKAKRSKTPKKIVIVPETNTTRRCCVCRELTGPTGQSGLRVRSWHCSACGAEQIRDRTGAWNILQAGSQAAMQAVTRGSRASVARTAKAKGTSVSRSGTGVRNAPAPRPEIQGRVSEVRASGKPATNPRKVLAAPKRIHKQGVAKATLLRSRLETVGIPEPLASERQDAITSTLLDGCSRSGLNCCGGSAVTSCSEPRIGLNCSTRVDEVAEDLRPRSATSICDCGKVP